MVPGWRRNSSVRYPMAAPEVKQITKLFDNMNLCCNRNTLISEPEGGNFSHNFPGIESVIPVHLVEIPLFCDNQVHQNSSYPRDAAAKTIKAILLINFLELS